MPDGGYNDSTILPMPGRRSVCPETCPEVSDSYPLQLHSGAPRCPYLTQKPCKWTTTEPKVGSSNLSGRVKKALPSGVFVLGFSHATEPVLPKSRSAVRARRSVVAKQGATERGRGSSSSCARSIPSRSE